MKTDEISQSVPIFTQPYVIETQQSSLFTEKQPYQATEQILTTVDQNPIKEYQAPVKPLPIDETREESHKRRYKRRRSSPFDRRGQYYDEYGYPIDDYQGRGADTGFILVDSEGNEIPVTEDMLQDPQIAALIESQLLQEQADAEEGISLPQADDTRFPGDIKGRKTPTKYGLPPNTEEDGEHRITCKDGFFGDENIEKEGCWACNPKCHIRATCVKPGYCVCNSGYIGDGVTKCKTPAPFVIGHTSSQGEVKVNITGIPRELSFKRALCKFGSDIFEAKAVSHSQIVCGTPSIYGSLSVSVDGEEWSDPFEFVAANKPPVLTKTSNNNLLLVGAGACISSVLYMLYSFCSHSSSSPNLAEELNPLIAQKKDPLQ